MNIHDGIEYKYGINILESLPGHSWLSYVQ